MRVLHLVTTGKILEKSLPNQAKLQSGKVVMKGSSQTPVGKGRAQARSWETQTQREGHRVLTRVGKKHDGGQDRNSLCESMLNGTPDRENQDRISLETRRLPCPPGVDLWSETPKQEVVMKDTGQTEVNVHRQLQG